MRLPARAIVDHLVWTHTGAVWAVWQVAPVSVAWMSHDDQLALHQRLRAALAALPADSLVLSVRRRVAAGELVEAMIDGVDLEGCPAWRAEAEATLAELDGRELLARRHYLAVRLPDDRRGAAGGLATGWAAARDAIAERFGIAGLPPNTDEVAGRRRQAELCERRLAGRLTLTRVAGGELCWLYARALRRGVVEPDLDDRWTDHDRADRHGRRQVSRAALAPLADVVVCEGGASDDRDRPVHRRYVRIDSQAGSSYQALLALATMPAEWDFPDAGGWLAALDRLPFAVDWALRVRAVDNQAAQAKARNQQRQLAGQFDEHDGDLVGAPGELSDAVAAVDAERAELAANRSEPELQTTVIFAVAAHTPGEVEGRAEQLHSLLAVGEFGLGRPTGGQTALLAAMLPGSATPRVARDYTQYLLPGDLASGLPFAGRAVGEPAGMLMGGVVDDDSEGAAGSATPVLFDSAAGPAEGRSGSLGVAGALGSGKSYFVKRAAHATLARGGQVVALDRTERGEYVAFADVAPGTAQVVRLSADAPVCLDPLRVFAGDAAVTAATGFLAVLTQVTPTEVEGVAIAEAVEAAADRRAASLSAAVDELAARADGDADADRAYRKVKAASRNRLAGLAFGGAGRELASLDADYLVFHTPGLVLPTREELASEHLARQLLPEQIVSQALLYLVAAAMRRLTWGDWHRFAVAVLDEAWALTASLQGRQLLLDLLRDGRKHNAAVWLLTQHADDLGDDQLAHLLGHRMVFRQDTGAVESAARLVGVDADEATHRLLVDAPAGRCLYRDAHGRVACVQVAPASEELHVAFDTNPTAGPDADGDEAAAGAGDAAASPVVALPAPADRGGDGDDGEPGAMLA